MARVERLGVERLQTVSEVVELVPRRRRRARDGPREKVVKRRGRRRRSSRLTVRGRGEVVGRERGRADGARVVVTRLG